MTMETSTQVARRTTTHNLRYIVSAIRSDLQRETPSNPIGSEGHFGLVELLDARSEELEYRVSL